MGLISYFIETCRDAGYFERLRRGAEGPQKERGGAAKAGAEKGEAQEGAGIPGVVKQKSVGRQDQPYGRDTSYPEHDIRGGPVCPICHITFNPESSFNIFVNKEFGQEFYNECDLGHQWTVYGDQLAFVSPGKDPNMTGKVLFYPIYMRRRERRS